MGNGTGEIKNFKFELTDELIDQIIFCMEDQSNEYRIDINTGDLITVETAHEETIPIPEWKSSDGFLMMEKFISSLHNPVYKEELRNVLSFGRGVFKNFKNIVKAHEPLKKRWYNFKDGYMKDLVVEWYTTYREAWHFEKIGTDTLETENLILSDFTFSSDCSRWENDISRAEEEFIQEVFKENVLLGQFHYENLVVVRKDPEKKIICVCAEALDGKFAGVIWGLDWTPGDTRERFLQDEGSLLVVKVMYVEPLFRGLGLGKVLVEEFSKKAEEEEAAGKIFFEVPENLPFLSTMLEKQGYQPVSRTYTRKLSLLY